MNTTDTTALQERIEAALIRATDDGADRTEEYAAAVLPIIAAEVRKGQADAWEEGYGDCWTYHQSEGMKGTECNPYRSKED